MGRFETGSLLYNGFISNGGSFKMKSGRSKIIIADILLGIIAGLSVLFFRQFRDKTESDKKDKAIQPQPVEVAQIQRVPIVLRRTFSGT
ncbi:MAG: hypothetical protein KKC46_22565 [Proteobacteria bacterium]|nr:hypothetical protein [Pseudomonadota bacterium]